MGLINGSLQIGRSAIMAHQSAMQVIGNNIANAGNTNYTRQTPHLSSVPGSRLDGGAGVLLTGIERQIDAAIEQRLRTGWSDKSYDQMMSDYLARMETLYNEMTTNDISTGLSAFFNSFSALQINPEDGTARSSVIHEAQSLIDQIQSLRKDLVGLYTELTDSTIESVDGINKITKQIADLNVRIAQATSTGVGTGSLLDQRDALLKELSEFADILAIDQPNGTVTVYMDTDPLVQYDQARELKIEKVAEGDVVVPKVYFADTGKETHIQGGRAGAVDDLIHQIVRGNLNDLDTLAAGLIFEVNKLHSSGQGLHGYTQVFSSNRVTDSHAALNNAGLPFKPVNGSFMITVKDATTHPPTETVTQINVNLSGMGVPTTLAELAAQINAVGNIKAEISPDGRLKLSSTSENYTFTFNDDTSNVLACLGINGFFTGTNASNIAVNSDLTADPQLVACGKSNTPLPGNSTNAELISKLPITESAMLGGMSITEYYRNLVGRLGTQTATSNQKLEVHTAIVESLQAQRDAISGVSLDEETINLMSNQRAFQGSAKFITVVNQLLQTVLDLI
jgi:flagellar hook-associated protein 1 FlgK